MTVQVRAKGTPISLEFDGITNARISVTTQWNYDADLLTTLIGKLSSTTPDDTPFSV